MLTLTRAEVVGLLEHGVGALPRVAGQFAQIGGVEFSFDPDLPEGERVRNAGVFDSDGDLIAELVKDGQIAGDPDERFRLVTLNFLAAPRFDDDGNYTGGGDRYPFPNLNTDPSAGEVGESGRDRTGEPGVPGRSPAYVMAMPPSPTTAPSRTPWRNTSSTTTTHPTPPTTKPTRAATWMGASRTSTSARTVSSTWSFLSRRHPNPPTCHRWPYVTACIVGGAENVDFDAITDRAFVSTYAGITAVDAADPSALKGIAALDPRPRRRRWQPPVRQLRHRRPGQREERPAGRRPAGRHRHRRRRGALLRRHHPGLPGIGGGGSAAGHAHLRCDR